jgi:urease accessory protein
MLILTTRLSANDQVPAEHSLSLTADERTRARHRFQTDDGQDVFLELPRGIVLQEGDLLQTAVGDRTVRVHAKPEPVLTVTAHTAFDLLRAAYHLGNRHVPLEVTAHYLRLSPDPVLQTMLEQMGLTVQQEQQPFHPEVGAYSQHSSQPHNHPHHHDSHHSRPHPDSHHRNQHH